MDRDTHTHMQGLVQRGSASGSLPQRLSYYSNDGSNNPPLSPTAKWKGDVHAFEEPPKDPNRHPYLPHPFPLKRRGRALGSHPGGFLSLQEPLQTPKFPDEEQIYSTYAEWWHAQRPKNGPPHEKDATFSTSFWPYGRRISCVASMDSEDQFYNLDKRVVKNHAFFKDRRDPRSMSSTGFSRSLSSSQAELLGSQAEHFGYHRSLGRSMSSHASATFHAENKLAPGEPYAQTSKPGRNVWDSMSAQASQSLPPAGVPASAGQRAASVPSTGRSDQARAGNSQYQPKSHLRNLGLGQRTHAEWCLPQPPAYAS